MTPLIRTNEVKRTKWSSVVEACRTLARFTLKALGFQIFLVFLDTGKNHGGSLHDRLVRSFDKGLTDTFHEAVIVDKSEKEFLATRVGIHARTYVDLEPWRLIILQGLTIIKYYAFIVLSFAFSYGVVNYYPEVVRALRPAFSRSVVLLLILILPRIVLVVIAQSLIRRAESHNRVGEVFYRISLIGKLAKRWPAICALVYFIWLIMLHRKGLNQGLNFSQQITYMALLLALFVALGNRLISLVGKICTYLFNRSRNKQFAESVIAIHLLILVELLRSSKEKVGENRTRRLAIRLLDDIASRFETSLPEQIIGNDLSSAPLKQELSKIGAGVRALKRLVAIPNSKSWDEELRLELSDFLVKFLSLNWSALPTDATLQAAEPHIVSRIKLVIRTVITAAIPAILLAVLQTTPFRLTGQVLEYAVIVSLAWFALSLVLRFDPEFQVKTKALKEVQDILATKVKS